tara:strand:- start:10247 stop:10924 length:678 start_codon:yes stop_codon:yes gene_type:complete
MVNIDTVYQKVLALANKEQRGYITPQEFNLFADHAQAEIFEHYFYELEQRMRAHGNSEEYSDTIDNLQEKISIFERTSANNNTPVNIPDSVYRLGSVFYGDIEVQQIQRNELGYINNSPLLKPRLVRGSCYYIRQGNQIRVYPSGIEQVTYTYVERPSKPQWAYTVINGNAMYLPTNSRDFTLHASEETELVYKILRLAGVAIQKQDIVQTAMGIDQLNIQQEKQ